jgi:uncharacterized protein
MPNAMITGGSRGLGLAYARELAARGHDLVLVARDPEALERAAAELRDRVSVEVLAVDLTVPAQRRRVERRLADPARPIDLLVNNAGIESTAVFEDAPVADLQTEIDLNVTAIMALTRAVVPGMRERGSGSVINVASFAGYLPSGGNAYGATKSWVLAFTDTVAASLVGSGVRMLAVCCGRIRAGAGDPVSPLWLDPADIVRTSLADLDRGRTLSVPGWVYRGVVGLLESPRTALRFAARLAGRSRERCARATEEPAVTPLRAAV